MATEPRAGDAVTTNAEGGDQRLMKPPVDPSPGDQKQSSKYGTSYIGAVITVRMGTQLIEARYATCGELFVGVS